MAKGVYDYFTQALRRSRGPLIGTPGHVVFGADGVQALFAIDGAAGRIAAATYRCTTCVTLVAFCEHLAELVHGATLEQAASLRAADLLALHREVPDGRTDRASVAVAALHAALGRQQEGLHP